MHVVRLKFVYASKLVYTIAQKFVMHTFFALKLLKNRAKKPSSYLLVSRRSSMKLLKKSWRTFKPSLAHDRLVTFKSARLHDAFFSGGVVSAELLNVNVDGMRNWLPIAFFNKRYKSNWHIS